VVGGRIAGMATVIRKIYNLNDMILKNPSFCVFKSIGLGDQIIKKWRPLRDLSPCQYTNSPSKVKKHKSLNSKKKFGNDRELYYWQ
jgi:hypothetical protein